MISKPYFPKHITSPASTLKLAYILSQTYTKPYFPNLASHSSIPFKQHPKSYFPKHSSPIFPFLYVCIPRKHTAYSIPIPQRILSGHHSAYTFRTAYINSISRHHIHTALKQQPKSLSPTSLQAYKHTAYHIFAAYHTASYTIFSAYPSISRTA